MIKLIINGVEMDLKGTEDIAVTYQTANDFKFHSNTSVQLSLPKTMTNLSAFENSDVIINDTLLPYDFIEASCEVDGIDMKIEYASLEQITHAEIKCRLFGGNVTLFSDVKDKSIRDLDLTAYDHTRNWAAISGLLNETSGNMYPLLDYGTLSTLNNDVDIERLYPGMFYHTLVSAIMSESGYTLAGDLASDTNYLKLFIPYSNRTKEFTDDYIASLLFEAVLSVDTAHNTDDPDITQTFTQSFDSEVSDPSNSWITNTYYAKIAATYAFHIKFRFYAGGGLGDITLRMNRYKAGGALEIMQSWELADFTVEGGGYYNIDEAATAVELDVDQRIVFTVSFSGSFSVMATGTSLELTAITNYLNGYGELWQTAANLPDISQGDILKYAFEAFGCIVQGDDSTKTITATKISTIIQNAYDGDYDDWSDLLDRSDDGVLTFKQDIAQINHLKYLDDDNVVKPFGTDFEFRVQNRNLPVEKDIYVAPFGASVFTDVFTFTEHIWRVEIDGTAEPKPRVLVANSVTFGGNISYIYNDASQLTTNTGNAPYFIDGRTFDLGFSMNLRHNSMKEYLELHEAPKQLSVKIRLTAKHINQLNFAKPVWLDYYKCWFYKRKISQFKFNKTESTVCELVKLF